MDDIVFNFTPATASTSGPSAGAKVPGAKKGGRWTDRAKDKRKGNSGGGGAKRPRQSYGGDNGDNDSGSRAGGGDDEGQAQAKRPRGAASAAGGIEGGGGGGKRIFAGGYVSSLFTAEDLPAPSKKADAIPVLAARPSNAPLSADAADEEDDANEEEEQEIVDSPTTKEPSAAALAQAQAIANAPKALTKLGLHPLLASHLSSKLSIATPTSAQSLVLPTFLRSPSTKTPFDAILRFQTGSGKTLSFLLPLLQDLLFNIPRNSGPQGSENSRDLNTLAIILSPTRELAAQTFAVLESLLSLPSSSDFTFSPRALTPCLLVGGANRTHEKRRLRKGCPIIVATPGRLLDHLRTTESFRMAGEAPPSKGPRGRLGNANLTPLSSRGRNLGLRWLVVDECDRLMDLGFEEQMKGVMEELERRSPSALLGAEEVGRRRTVLCSATAGEGVQRLEEMAVKAAKVLTLEGGGGSTAQDNAVINATKAATSSSSSTTTTTDMPPVTTTIEAPPKHTQNFLPPTQLLHNYILTPPKLRFVTLIAQLRRLLLPSMNPSLARGTKKPTKILVFLSCTAAVDFYWKAFDQLSMTATMPNAASEANMTNVPESTKVRIEREKAEAEAARVKLASKSSVLPGVPIYRLHGNMELQNRMASLSAFSKDEGGGEKGKGGKGAVMLCTSVAARGLDVDGVGEVIQFDLATEGGVTEYIHRAGRTARAGQAGQVTSILLPSEKDWVPWVESGMSDSSAKGTGAEGGAKMRQLGVEDVLRNGFGGEDREYESRATDVQMALERWVTEDDENAALAKNAFQSHIRAYATHPSAEKEMFNTKLLHLGHIAKSFGMREAPGKPLAGNKKGGKKGRVEAPSRESLNLPGNLSGRKVGSGGGFETGRVHDEERAKKRKEIKTMKGPTGDGAGEFQVASAEMLEGLARMQGGKRKR